MFGRQQSVVLLHILQALALASARRGKGRYLLSIYSKKYLDEGGMCPGA